MFGKDRLRLSIDDGDLAGVVVDSDLAFIILVDWTGGIVSALGEPLVCSLMRSL